MSGTLFPFVLSVTDVKSKHERPVRSNLPRLDKQYPRSI